MGGRRRKTGSLDTYSVYSSDGKKLAGGVDREVAMRKKAEARGQGDGNVTVIRSGQEGKTPGPRNFDI